MFYQNWMSYIKDEAKITKIAVPGTHNSATKGIMRFGECQKDSLYEQYLYGVRKFDIRVRYSRSKLYITHGLLTGMTAEEAFADLGRIINESDEFFIIDLKPYTVQELFGPFYIKLKGNTPETDRLIKKYLSPEKYAFTDFDDINTVTMGDIRRSGKRYVINHHKEIYAYSRDCKLYEPWDPILFGTRPEKFARECLKYLKNDKHEGLFLFQTQQTPGVGTELGLKWPDALEKLSKPHFPQIMAQIASDSFLLDRVNLVASDFMTADHSKINEILNLNLLKGIVKENRTGEYAAAIGKEPHTQS